MLSHTGYENPSISARSAHKTDLPWPKRTCLDTLRRKLFKNLAEFAPILSSCLPKGVTFKGSLSGKWTDTFKT